MAKDQAGRFAFKLLCPEGLPSQENLRNRKLTLWKSMLRALNARSSEELRSFYNKSLASSKARCGERCKAVHHDNMYNFLWMQDIILREPRWFKDVLMFWELVLEDISLEVVCSECSEKGLKVAVGDSIKFYQHHFRVDDRGTLQKGVFLTAYKSKILVGPDHSQHQKMGPVFRQQTTIIFSVDFDTVSRFLSCQEIPFVKEMYF